MTMVIKSSHQSCKTDAAYPSAGSETATEK